MSGLVWTRLAVGRAQITEAALMVPIHVRQNVFQALHRNDI